MLVIVGVLAAIAIHLGVTWAAGDDASDRDKAIAAALVSLVTLLGTSVQGWLTDHLAPWISAKVVCQRYGSLFPCTPEGLGKGRQAQEALARACRERSADNWGVQQTSGLLQQITDAVEAGEYHGGPNWKCLQPIP